MGERLAPIGHPPLSEDEANRRCNALADPELCRQFWASETREKSGKVLQFRRKEDMA